mmetsp:Transcript_38423/g.113975  ORF Transcript_38423/g.113975 Transcript_38423/m.113975 type:complete len:218 (-) Transcript_38423:1550-2203(-)
MCVSAAGTMTWADASSVTRRRRRRRRHRRRGFHASQTRLSARRPVTRFVASALSSMTLWWRPRATAAYARTSWTPSSASAAWRTRRRRERALTASRRHASLKRTTSTRSSACLVPKMSPQQPTALTAYAGRPPPAAWSALSAVTLSSTQLRSAIAVWSRAMVRQGGGGTGVTCPGGWRVGSGQRIGIGQKTLHNLSGLATKHEQMRLVDLLHQQVPP